MKAVLIKWHRGDQYEKRGERKAAIRNAHKTIRQQTKTQLQKCCDGMIQYDDFIQPSVRLGYFD